MTSDNLNIVIKSESDLAMDEERNIITNHSENVLRTEVSGFDELFTENGIPKGNSILIAGGPGTGKSTLCRHICYNLISK